MVEKYSLTKVEMAKWGLLSAVALVDAIAIALGSMTFTVTPTILTTIALAIVVSSTIAAYYHFVRDEPHFTHTFVSLAQYCLFLVVGCIAAYLAVAAKFPFQDEILIRGDRFLKFHVEGLVAWIEQFPVLGRMLAQVYLSLVWQILFTFAFLGIIRGKRERIDEFVLLMMITLILTTAIAIVFPAAGPCCGLIENVVLQQPYIDHLNYIRTEPNPVIAMGELTGMLTFPSYHTVLACIMIYVYRSEKYVFPLMTVLNLTMIFSTLTHGCHYLADVIAGLLVFAVGVFILRLILGSQAVDRNTVLPDPVP